MRKRGEIWRADLNPRRGTEPGRARPVLIVQAQAQVRAIDNRRLVRGPMSRLSPQQLDAIAHALLEVLELPGE